MKVQKIYSKEIELWTRHVSRSQHNVSGEAVNEPRNPNLQVLQNFEIHFILTVPSISNNVNPCFTFHFFSIKAHVHGINNLKSRKFSPRLHGYPRKAHFPEIFTEK